MQLRLDLDEEGRCEGLGWRRGDTDEHAGCISHNI